MILVSANIATLVPKAERAAARAGLRQGQRTEELERMFDDAGADVIALQEHRLQTTGQRCGGLFSSATPQGTFDVAIWFRRSRFKQFEVTANAVSSRILSVCMTSTTQCFRFVVAHSPHSGQAADQVAMDSFCTELLSVTSPQTPDERVLLMRDFNAMVGSVRSEAIGGVGAETESKNGSRFRIFLDGTSMCAINTFAGDGSNTWYGKGTVKAVRNCFICCHKSLFPSVVSCRVIEEVELSENTRVDDRALAVSFHSSTFQFQTSKRTRILTRAPPKASRVLCGDSWRQKAFQQCLPCSIPKHIQIDEAYAEMVATQRETFRAPLCRPSKWWIGAHNSHHVNFVPRVAVAAFVMFRSVTYQVWWILQTYMKPQIFSSCVKVSPSGFVRVVRATPWLLWTKRHTSAPSLSRRKQRNTMETSKFSTSLQESLQDNLASNQYPASLWRTTPR